MSESDNWQPPTPGINASFSSPVQSEKKAGFWMRFVAHVIDQITCGICSIPAAILGTAIGGSNLSNLFQSITTIVLLSYWIGKSGGTPLRARLGVLVLDENNGSYIGFNRALGRTLMSFVSALVVMLGYIWLLWDPKRQTWHDKVAKSVVVWRQ